MYKGGNYVLEKEKMPGCPLLSPFCPVCWDLVSMARRAPVSSPSDSGFGSWALAALGRREVDRTTSFYKFGQSGGCPRLRGWLEHWELQGERQENSRVFQ